VQKRWTAGLVASAAAAAAMVVSPAAQATNAFEVPDTGVEQLGRGAAWVARAAGPLAAFMNPAAMATQQSGVSIDVNLIWQKTCLSTFDATGAPTKAAFSGNGYPGTYPAETCNTNSGTPFPNPALAAVWRASPRLAFGFSLRGPNSPGKITYPDVVTSREGRTMPAPTRYMLLEQSGVVLLPTLSAGYSITPDLQVGAGFIWGIASMQFSNISQALGSNQQSDDWSTDVKATLKAKDLLFPGAIVAALYEPSPLIDVGVWYTISDDIKAKGDAYIEGTYYNDPGTAKDPSRYNCGDGKQSACTQTPADSVSVTIRQPMQARFGVRFHQPRPVSSADDRAAPAYPFRDPIAHDVFDIEADFTWSHNSVFENLEIRFPDNPPVNIDWLAGGIAPPNADVPHHFRDVFGLRLGADYVVIPSKLAVRAGGFFESRGQDDQYLNIDFVPAARFAATAGATFRVGDFDLMVAGSHIFPSKLDNGGHGALRGLAGSQATSPVVNRTQFFINGGSVTQRATTLAIGSTWHF